MLLPLVLRLWIDLMIDSGQAAPKQSIMSASNGLNGGLDAVVGCFLAARDVTPSLYPG